MLAWFARGQCLAPCSLAERSLGAMQGIVLLSVTLQLSGILCAVVGLIILLPLRIFLDPLLYPLVFALAILLCEPGLPCLGILHTTLTHATSQSPTDHNQAEGQSYRLAFELVLRPSFVAEGGQPNVGTLCLWDGGRSFAALRLFGAIETDQRHAERSEAGAILPFPHVEHGHCALGLRVVRVALFTPLRIRHSHHVLHPDRVVAGSATAPVRL